MRLYQKVLSFLVLLILLGHNIQASTCDSVSLKLMEQTWREFRAIHPFGFQTVGKKTFDDGTYVFVMSEPAEWVKKEDLDRLFDEYGGHVITAKKKFGYDGALYDAVGCVKLSSKVFGGFENRLFTLLYGTEYRPYYTDLNHLSRHVYFAENCIDAIKPFGWLAKHGSYKFYEILQENIWKRLDYFCKILDIDPMNSLFHCKEQGIVVWRINVDTDYSDSLFQKNARRFVLDSDLVLAAFCTPLGSMVFVGREREIPVTVLPPLRTETIRLLASLDEGDFSVSINSGLDNEADFDGHVEDSIWARPVVMSDKLKNTELGNLLMLTDVQLLSWGNHAEVCELFIDYPQPAHPLYDLGFTYQYEKPDAYYWKLPVVNTYKSKSHDDDVSYVVLDNLGCLQPLYASSNENSPYFEERAYTIFSSLNNTDQIRATQYALIYKAFRIWKHRTVKSLSFTNDNTKKSWIQTPSMAILNVPWGTVNYLE